MIAMPTFLFIGGSKHRQKLPIKLPNGSNFPDRHYRCVVPKPLNLRLDDSQTSEAFEELEYYSPRFIRCEAAEFCYFAIENLTDEQAFKELLNAAAQ